jgi:hypothetical protein
MDGDELRVQIGEMDERDLAQRREAQQFFLRQALLGEGARRCAERRGSKRDLQEIAATQHRSFKWHRFPSPVGRGRGPPKRSEGGRERGGAKRMKAFSG